MTIEQAINHLEEELKNKQDWSCVACKEEHEQLLGWLKELQAIKNTNPSEAMKCLEKPIIKFARTSEDIDFRHYEEYDTIKNYILKAQEQEKALKIIKEKNVDYRALKNAKTYKEYNALILDFNPTITTSVYFLVEEEFNTLKEYFKNE